MSPPDPTWAFQGSCLHSYHGTFYSLSTHLALPICFPTSRIRPSGLSRHFSHSAVSPCSSPGGPGKEAVTMENMAEEELLPQEKVEVVQVPVPTPTPDSARVPAPAPDSAPVSASTPAPASAPTPASAPVPAPALAQAPALSPSLASAPDEAESSKCREAQIFLPQEKQESAPCWGVGEALLHWNVFYGGKGSFSEMGGGTRDPYSGKKRVQGGGRHLHLETFIHYSGTVSH